MLLRQVHLDHLYFYELLSHLLYQHLQFNIGSLIFETPIQHDYEAGVKVRSLLSTEQLEEIDGRLAALDVDPSSGTRFVRVNRPSAWLRTPVGLGWGNPKRNLTFHMVL